MALRNLSRTLCSPGARRCFRASIQHGKAFSSSMITPRTSAAACLSCGEGLHVPPNNMLQSSEPSEAWGCGGSLWSKGSPSRHAGEGCWKERPMSPTSQVTWVQGPPSMIPLSFVPLAWTSSSKTSLGGPRHGPIGTHPQWQQPLVPLQRGRESQTWTGQSRMEVRPWTFSFEPPAQHVHMHVLSFSCLVDATKQISFQTCVPPRWSKV